MYCDTLIGVFCTVTGSVTVVETYVGSGVLPTVTVPETLTEPVIGSVAEVDIYVFHGVVPCVAVTVPEMGSVTLVLT